jgi:hypothetical protein
MFSSVHPRLLKRTSTKTWYADKNDTAVFLSIMSLDKLIDIALFCILIRLDLSISSTFYEKLLHQLIYDYLTGAHPRSRLYKLVVTSS